MKETLLDKLASTEKILISDLKDVAGYPKTIAILKKLPVDSYPIEEWNYCLSYIFDRPFHFETRQEILRFIEESGAEPRAPGPHNT